MLKALVLCNFQQYCIVLQWVKESSRRGDVTAKAAAEWWTAAAYEGWWNEPQASLPSQHNLINVRNEDMFPPPTQPHPMPLGLGLVVRRVLDMREPLFVARYKNSFDGVEERWIR